MPAESLCFLGHANDLHKAALTPFKNEMQIVFPADPLAVRKALKASIFGLSHLELGPDEKGVIEIVLAEVLNNVVEHAYHGVRTGVIELRVKRAEDHLSFVVLDDGIPLPDQETPTPHLHDLDCSMDSMPEGGFGWFIIQELTQNLSYKRDGVRNRLEFSVALQNKPLS